MDDTAEKVRRNLVGVSAGILAVVALGIPLDGKLVGAVNLDNVQPWRAWLCTTFVLGYFWLRFYLEPERAQDREQRRRNIQSARATQYEELVREQFDKYCSNSKSLVKFDLPSPPSEHLKPLGYQTVEWLAFYSRGKLDFSWYEAGQVNAYPAQFVQEKRFQARFTVPVRIRLSVVLSGHIGRLRNPTWDGVEHSFPHFLALVALGVCLYKLAKALTDSFPFISERLLA